MERIKLKVLGITYNQVQSGAYALVLAQVDGPYRIPVVIGVSEAQSIAARLENIVPPRPMSHDLFVSMASAFGIKLDEVFIYKFEDGVFSAELKFSSEERQIALDSRTSDAIALALRSKAPIYTTPEIMKEAGFILDNSETDEQGAEHIVLKKKLEDVSLEELKEMMHKCVDSEEYERAAEIKAAIRKKQEKK